MYYRIGNENKLANFRLFCRKYDKRDSSKENHMILQVSTQ